MDISIRQRTHICQIQYISSTFIAVLSKYKRDNYHQFMSGSLNRYVLGMEELSLLEFRLYTGELDT